MKYTSLSSNYISIAERIPSHLNLIESKTIPKTNELIFFLESSAYLSRSIVLLTQSKIVKHTSLLSNCINIAERIPSYLNFIEPKTIPKTNELIFFS